MIQNLTKTILILLVFITFIESTKGKELNGLLTLSIKNQSNAKSFGIYQIAWNPSQFKDELNKNLSILNKKPSVVMFFRDISFNRGFPLSYVEIIDNVGSIPMISWELDIWGRSNEIDYLDAILENRFDSYFIQWSRDCKKWGKPVFIRPGFEMNGNWFSWCSNPDKFKAVWQYLYKLFKREGCDNTIWVWSPGSISFPDEEWNQMEKYYPGDQFVDWVGLDGYNQGDENPKKPYSKWITFSTIFNEPLERLNKLAPDKPVMIAEIGCAESESHSKAEWIEDAFANINNLPELKLLIWFNYDKRGEGEADWRIDSSPETLNTFNKCIDGFKDLSLTN
ncbi:MAG: glycoside hydrolase family 26 protein [Candidatus Anammoxibacter sp.]